jgi:hypothetical protein
LCMGSSFSLSTLHGRSTLGSVQLRNDETSSPRRVNGVSESTSGMRRRTSHPAQLSDDMSNSVRGSKTK